MDESRKNVQPNPPPLLSLLLLLLLSNGSKLAWGGKEKKRKTKRDWNAKKGCFAGNAGLGEAVRYGVLRYIWCGSGGGGGMVGLNWRKRARAREREICPAKRRKVSAKVFCVSVRVCGCMRDERRMMIPPPPLHSIPCAILGLHDIVPTWYISH